MANVVEQSFMRDREQLLELLSWYAEQVVRARQEGKLRQAVIYRQQARGIGVTIMQRVETGIWG